MKKGFVFITLLITIVISNALIFADEKVLTMGYKEEDKMPMIGDVNNNTGAYQELFTKAAAMIGYKLNIVRSAKKRIFDDIEAGNIDFWPGASFDQERAKYMYFIDNGFTTKEVLVSRNDLSEVKDINSLSGLTIWSELGSADYATKYSKLKVHEVIKLPMPTVVEALNEKRGDLYIADIEVIYYFQKTHKIKNFNDIGLKVHYNAIENYKPMYVGFSRKSSKFKETANPNFNPSAAISIANFPTVISPNCVAYQFAEALKKLKDNGEAQRIYDKYLK